MMKPIGLIFLPAALLSLPLAAAQPVSMFPPDAIELDQDYRDWYGPQLEKLQESPLWPEDQASSGKETIRFTFIPGAMRVRGRHATVIRIDMAEGKGRLIARTQIVGNGGHTIRKVADKSISPAEIAKITELASTADPWKFRVGDWDGSGAISIHCTELIMERRQPAGYAVSHILISCNRPARLMPLVDYVAKLAGQKRSDLRY